MEASTADRTRRRLAVPSVANPAATSQLIWKEGRLTKCPLQRSLEADRAL